MKTVFISIPWFSPAFKAGGPIRSVHNLVTKFDKDIQYRIFCSNKDVDGQKLDNIETDKWIDFNENIKVWYDSSILPFFKMNRLIAAQKIDFLYIVGLFSFSFNILPIFFSRVKKTIVSPKGMLHTGALSKKKIKKRIFLKFMKIAKVANRIHFHASDLVESIFIRSIFGGIPKITIASNYSTFFHNNSTAKKQKSKLKLITVALVSPMKNHLLVLNALKLCEGEIEYHIIGAIKDKSYWKKCLDVISEMPVNVKVKFLGEITPDNIGKCYDDSPVMIMPSESENYGHSIIEALSVGIPVITSTTTPWNFLQENNAGFNTDRDISKIRELIEYYVSLDEDEYLASSLAAIKYSKANYNESDLDNQYASLFLN